MTKEQKFHDLCEAQIERLGGAFPDFRFTKLGAVQELVAWLQDHAKGDRTRANEFITAVTEFPAMPTIAQLNALWYQMWPNKDTAAREQREACTRCDGTGWITVQGPFGTSAAYPCTHAPETDSDRRMGVRIPPAVANHYREEAINAEPRRQLHVGSGGNVNQSELTRVNLATIGKLVHGFETGERRESNS